MNRPHPHPCGRTLPDIKGNPLDVSAPMLVLSTCGTSVLTNVARDMPGFGGRLRATANLTEGELTAADKDAIDAVVKDAEGRLAAADVSTARQLAAELNALLGLQGGTRPRRGRPDLHYLIATDTYQGALAAGVLAEALPRLWPNSDPPIVHRQHGLNTADADSFSQAMSELGKWIHDLVGEISDYHVVFNPTGGFKAVLGMLQTFGMFYADETVYLFEGEGAPLLHIPRLPVRMDAAAVVIANRETFRRLALYAVVPLVEIAALRDSALVLVVGDDAMLSAWGELLWAQVHPQLYRKEVLPPLSNRIRFSETFESHVADLPPDRKLNLNRRIDDLSRYLDEGRRVMPKSLSYKALRGSPVHGSTHEFYAWSDQDAARVFCHEEDGVVILDSLRKHL